jgi:site-specific DNA recombinase
LQHEYETLKKELESNQQKKEKFLGLYKDDLIEIADLVKRLSTLNEEQERLKERLSPIELQMGKVVHIACLVIELTQNPSRSYGL